MSRVVVISTKGNILYTNQKVVEEFPLPVSGINDVLKTVLACSEEEADKIQQKVLSGNGHQIKQTIMTGGQTKTYITNIEPLMEKDTVSSLAIISSDISQLLEESEISTCSTRNQFLANMNHELRTPLIGILGSVDLLLQSKLNNIQTENVEVIKDCGEQLLDIINEILNVSKLELGLVEINLEACNLFDIFSKAAKIIDPMLAKKGLGLKLDIPLKMPSHVLTDRVKLFQIICNILYNSVKFTNKGQIILKAAVKNELEQRSWLYVSVSDTGIGIPYSRMQEIFEPFTQLDNSSSRNFGGTGLGLYVCKKLLELMDGDIWVDNNYNNDRGTVVHFRIPIQIVSSINNNPDNKCNANEQIQDDFLMVNPRRILIVEDNHLNQKIVSQMLRTYGFEVSSASNGLECLNILQEKEFDAILMDMQMPLMDGYETTRFIAKDSSLNHIPIIAMTANAMIGDREKCLAAGCVSYLAKPFKTDELIQEIKKFLNRETSPSKNREQSSAPFIAELIPEFMALLSDMITDLDDAVEQKQFKKIQGISHDIKGTAGMYGFIKISKKAALIEQAAKFKARETILSLTKQLHYLFEEASAQVS